MKFGLDLPNMGVCADPRVLAQMAQAAEAAGWDGVFLWDSVYVKMEDPRNDPTCDPWIGLAAMAASTQRVRLGPMIEPIPRSKPWMLARTTVSMDYLSGGRLVLPVGLGYTGDGGFEKVGEELDRKVRARRLDEGLAILDGLWSGKPFQYEGEQFKVGEMAYQPMPMQQPRIPVWVVGAWPRMKSMRRTIRWDGVIPFKMSPDGKSMAEDGNAFASGMKAEDVRDLCGFVNQERQAKTPFDVVLEGDLPESRAEAAERIAPYAEAGATWWLDSMVWKTYYKRPGELEPLMEIIRRGPPQINN